MKRRSLLLLALAAALPAARAQTDAWPSKPVRMVVPFPPGGGTDGMARVIAARLTEDLGQSFFVENRAGAGGMIGAEFVARSQPDGYTVCFVPSSYASSANPALYKLTFDPLKGIAPVAQLSTQAYMLAVHPSVKANNLKELLELLRANPNTLSFGSSGTGGSLHLAVEMLLQLTRTQMLHVPYKGAGPALADLLAGRIQLIITDQGTVLPHIRAGKLRGIAVTTEQRSPQAPDLPSLSEQVPGYSMYGWYGVWAPPGTPPEIISRLNQALGRVLKQPEVQARMRTEGVDPVHSTPEEFSRLLARDLATWAKVVKDGNIKVD